MRAYTDYSSFSKNGFVIIPGVLSAKQIREARRNIYNKINAMPQDKRMLFISDIFNDDYLTELLISVQFNKKIVSCLKSLFDSDLCYINDFQIQCNMYGNGSRGGWHIDAGSESSNNYIYSKNYRFGKVGLYLQDNTFEFGGGTDLIPGSHQCFQRFGNERFNKFYAKANHSLAIKCQKFKKIMAPIKAGDAVFFDSRLLHRSSPPHAIELDSITKNAQRVDSSKINFENSKFSLYWDAGSEVDSRYFLKNSCKRAMLEEILVEDNRKEIFFADYLRYSYPKRYPEAYVSTCSATSNIKILSLSDQKANLFETALS